MIKAPPGTPLPSVSSIERLNLQIEVDQVMKDSLPQSPLSRMSVNLHERGTVALLLCALAIPLALLALRSQGLDFRAFFVAAKASAAHLDPYADNRQSGEPFVDVANENGISRWIYPPPALFFAAPLGWVSFAFAKLLFELLSIGSLVWVLLYLGYRFGIATVWLALVCISLPVIACVQRGQVDLLILLCIVLTYRFANTFWAGIPLGIAISIKIFPAALLLWWLLERKFKEVATAIAFTLGISLLAVLRYGAVSYLSFLHNLTELHSSASAAPSLGPLFSFSPGFVGSYNNPLILLGNAGIFVGLILTVAAALLLRWSRVPAEVGFFGMALVSQLMNTALWTMGMVMYIPICLIVSGRLRSVAMAVLFLLPLYLPSQIRIFGITPRLVIALVLFGYIAFTDAMPKPATTNWEYSPRASE